jgi:outer membrane lipoprotein-sorting protein
MKKSLILLAALLVASVCNAQTLDEIVKKYYAANGTENLEKATTISMEGKVIQMGTEMPISIIVKRPDKVKVVINYNGLEIITLFDGEKGYMVNPLAGATEPIEIPAEQLSSVQEYNLFNDSFLDAFKAGRVTLEGEEAVDGKPAFKVTITDEAGNITVSFIDKDSFLTVKTTQKVNQMGQEMEVESYVKEYVEVDGVKFGKVITQFVNGMELGGMTFDKIELNKEIDDSVFTIE